MPTLETIRRLKVEATAAGVAQTAAELQKLSAAQADVAKTSQVMGTVTDQTSRKQLSVEAAYKRQTLALDEVARKQDQFAKAARVADQHLAQGGINAEQHAQRIADLSAKYGVASTTSKAFAEATSGLSAQLIAMSAGAGPVGIFLSGLGKWGLAAAVGIGGAVSAFQAFSQAAHDIATKSGELKKFADTTGFTTDQVQNLGKEAKKFDVSSEDLEGGLRKFAAGFQELREGGGSLLQSIRRVNGGLAEQMQTDETAADALVHLQQAILSTDNVFEQSRIARAALGRGGVGAIEFLKSADLSKLNGDIAGIGYGLDKNLIARTYELNKQIEETDKKIAHAFGADFAPFFLRLELGWKGYELTVIEGLGRIKKGFEGAFIPPDTAQSKFVAGREAGVPAKLLNEQQRLTTLMQDQLAIAERIRKEEGFDNPGAERSEAIAARLREQLEAVDAQIKKIRGDTAEPMELQFKFPKFDIKGIQNAVFGGVDIGSPRTGLIGPTLDVGASSTIEAMVVKYKQLHDVLGALMPVEDQVANKMRELMIAEQNGIQITGEQTKALLAQTRAQAELAAVAPGTYERQLAALQALMAAYPGLTAAQAQAAHSLEQQLALAQAVTGAQKMMVQAAIDYQAAIDRGMTTEQASAEAAQKHAIAVAQVTAAAQAQLLSLRDQYAVASAITGAEKMRAQATATMNALLREGVDAYTAQAVAAQELANAVAAANAAVEQTIKGLQQELEVLKAGTQEEKDRVLARQAYDNAIASGADVEAAMRLQAATEAVSSEKRRQTEESQKQAAILDRINREEAERVTWLQKQQQYVNEIYAGMHQLLDEMSFNTGSGPGNQGMQGGKTGTVFSYQGQLMLQEIERLKKLGYNTDIPEGLGGFDYLNRVMQDPDRAQREADKARQAAVNEFEMKRIEAQIAGNKPGEISAVQGELAFWQGQPRSLESLQQIKSLTDALKELTDATQAQTATLSDIYGAGHAGRIGYYNEGTTTKVIGQPTISSNPPVWGNPITTPPAANTNIPGGGYNRPANWSSGASGGWAARVAFSGTLPSWVNMSDVPRFAEGGTVTRPTLALVGEAGPEDITPVGKRTGQPTVVQNFNIMMPARSDLGDRSTQRQMFEGIGRRAAVTR